MFGYASIASTFALLGVVTGHGGGQHYIIDGVVHKGYQNDVISCFLWKEK